MPSTAVARVWLSALNGHHKAVHKLTGRAFDPANVPPNALCRARAVLTRVKRRWRAPSGSSGIEGSPRKVAFRSAAKRCGAGGTRAPGALQRAVLPLCGRGAVEAFRTCNGQVGACGTVAAQCARSATGAVQTHKASWARLFLCAAFRTPRAPSGTAGNGRWRCAVGAERTRLRGCATGGTVLTG